MTVGVNVESVIARPGQQIGLASLLTLGAGLPDTIFVAMEDVNEYSLANPGSLGSLSGNGRTINFAYPNAKNTYEYLVFTYDSASGQYLNSNYGALSGLTYTAPTGEDHNETLVIFSPPNSGTLSLANFNPLAEVTIVSETSFTNPFPVARPNQATPNEIAAIGNSFVGKVWNNEGCEVLVADIAALAGSTLPLTATATISTAANPILAKPNGEWIVAYDGRLASQPSYASAEAVARPGDVVVITWQDGANGHVTMVVSGYGDQAEVVDNWNFGSNSAHDGSASDLILASPHLLSNELTGNYRNGQPDPAIAASIQIYRLDVPIIAVNQNGMVSAAGDSLTLAPYITTTDAAGAGSRAITEYSVYDSAGSGTEFLLNGVASQAHSAATALMVNAAQLAALQLVDSSVSAITDHVSITAYNGAYWGDQSLLPVSLQPIETASQAIAIGMTPSVAISDSAANIVANLDGLQALTAAGQMQSISLTDPSTPVIGISAAQLSNDSAVLRDVAGNFNLSISAAAANATIAGLSGHGNKVVFPGPASDYQVSANGNGSSFTLSDNLLASVDQLSNIQALQFNDVSEIVAAAPAAAKVTTGNVTELYAAVFGREPDVAGLAFYLTYQQTNPATPLLQYAEWFLSSPEYSNNPAHSYAASADGDSQFITAIYNNLLGRSPSATDISWYQSNVISPQLAGLTPGSAAYQAAENAAHAQTLVYFSASSEFLNDVQINAAHPASSAHWLLLI